MSHISHHRFKPNINELPKRFVNAMKILFDIMDDQKTGFINIRDIEKRWPRDTSSSLPTDVIECLRKVTPPNEMINFERFCAGLKMCLLRHRVGHRQPLGYTGQWYRGQYLPQVGQVTEPRGRPSSVPLPDREDKTLVRHQPSLKPPSTSISKPHSRSGRSLDNLAGNIAMRPSNTATVRPSNVTAQQRSISVPHLQGKELSRPAADVRRIPTKLRGYRSDARLTELRDQEPAVHRLSTLKTKTVDQSVDAAKATQIPTLEQLSIKRQEVRSQKENVIPVQSIKEMGNPSSVQNNNTALRKQSRKREPRRHTLGHGIEYSMLRRTKLLDQEKDVLLQGLRVVEHARDWYLQRISGVREKMQNTSKGHGAPEYSIDAHEERLRFQVARIFDVNQHLKALIESSDKGFPLHMNLAVQPPPYDVHQSSMVQRLKEQNHLLTEEVSQKSEVIAQLEREKATLIRELFQARSQHRSHADETTLM